ncbi:MAG: DUF2059 domain-containing protein [Candidatus Acidiferrales bacterium]
MKRFAFAILVSLLFASISFAQQSPSDAPASKEDIENYMQVMHVHDLMKSMLDSMTKQLHLMAHERMKKQPNLPPDAEARMDKMMDDLFKDFPVDELLQAMIPVYQKYLTKGDVDVLVAFYSGPTGQKILKEMPAMTAEAMQASSGIVQKMMTKAQDRVQSEIAEMQKESQGNSDKQSPPASN